jgi:hypothetical protein
LAHVKFLKLQEPPEVSFTANTSNRYCSRCCNEH